MRARGGAPDLCTGLNPSVGQDAALPANHCPCSDVGFLADPHLSSHDYIVFDDDTSGKARLSSDDDVPSDSATMPDVHQVVELRAVSDHGLFERRPVNAAIGAYFHIIADFDSSCLRELLIVIVFKSEAETVAADYHTGVQRDAIADGDIMRNRNPRIHSAVGSQGRALADRYLGRNLSIRADVYSCADDCIGADRDALIQLSGLRHNRRGMDTGDGSGRWVEQVQDPREGIAWFGNTDHRATVQAFDTWPNEKAPGARCPGCFLGCVPFGEGDLRLCCPLERVSREDFASAIALDGGAQLLSDFRSRHGP